MDARELEALSMLSRGFADLKDANPELAYNLVLDILSGINEYGSHFPRSSRLTLLIATNLFDSIFPQLAGYSHIVVFSVIPSLRLRVLLS
jgi:hypothetical protein